MTGIKFRAHKGKPSGEELQPVASTPTTFVVADLHFGDERMCGRGKRPFRDAQDMEEEIVRRWNEVVSPHDVVHVLGDLGSRKHLDTMKRLHGHKHLVAGNGDDLGPIARSGVFASIKVARWVPGFLLTHIPVHPSQLRGRTVNVHGHLHEARLDDPRYRCVSVEQTRYAPVRLHELPKPAPFEAPEMHPSEASPSRLG